MSNFIINATINLAIKLLTDITPGQWQLIKDKVISLQDSVLPNEEKHGEAAKYIHNLVHTTSITLIDFLIKGALLFVRKYQGVPNVK